MDKGRLQRARTVIYKCGDCGTIGHGTIATIPHGWYVILNGDQDFVLLETEVLPGGVVEEFISLRALFSAADVFCDKCIDKYWDID